MTATARGQDRRRVVRSILILSLGLVVGALAGFALGWRIGYCQTGPLYGSEGGLIFQGLLLAALAALLVIGLLVWAAVRHTWSPAVAAAALVVSALIGGNLAPAVSGSPESVSGTGSAGTREDPTAFWSGSVKCHWGEGDTAVEYVDGFDVRVSDPQIIATLGLDSAAIMLESPVRIRAIEAPRGNEDTYGFGVAEGPGDGYGWIGSERSILTYEELSSDRRSGTAEALDEVLVFTWSCSGGP